MLVAEGQKYKRKAKAKANVVRAIALRSPQSRNSGLGVWLCPCQCRACRAAGLDHRALPGDASQTGCRPFCGKPVTPPHCQLSSGSGESTCGAFVSENSLVSSVFNYQRSFDSSVSSICDRKGGRMRTITQYFPKHGMQAKMYIVNLFLVCRKNMVNLFMTNDTVWQQHEV